MKNPDSVCNLVFEYVEEFSEMKTDEQIAWAIGEISLAIGRGDLRSTVFRILERCRAVGYYQAKYLDKP